MESDRASGKLKQDIQAKFRKIAGFCPELHHLRNAEITLKMEKMDVWDPEENDKKQTEEKNDKVSVENLKQSDQASASITVNDKTISQQAKWMNWDDADVAKMLAEDDAKAILITDTIKSNQLNKEGFSFKIGKIFDYDPKENDKKQTEEKTDEVSVENPKQSDQASASITASDITVSEQVKSMHLDDDDVLDKMFAEEDAEESWKVKRHDEARKMLMLLIETPEQTSRFAALLLKLSFCCLVAGDVGEGRGYFVRGVQILREGPQCEPKWAEDLVLVAIRFAEQNLVKRSLCLMQTIVGLIKGIQNVEQQLDVILYATNELPNFIRKYDYSDANQLVEDLIRCSRRGQEAPDDKHLFKWMLVMLLCINLFNHIENISSGLKYLEEVETAWLRLNDGDVKTYLKVTFLNARVTISLKSNKLVEAKRVFKEMESMLPKIHGITDTGLKEGGLGMFKTTKQLIRNF